MNHRVRGIGRQTPLARGPNGAIKPVSDSCQAREHQGEISLLNLSFEIDISSENWLLPTTTF